MDYGTSAAETTPDDDSSRFAAASGHFTSIEVCAGAGGLALGLEQAGFDPVLVIENRPVACDTLRLNRPHWDVRAIDLLEFDPVDDQQVYGVDLLAAGLPRLRGTAAVARTPGPGDEFDLLKATVWLAHAVRPRALLIDNVPDLVTSDAYAGIRAFMEGELAHLGYGLRWFVINAVDHGVPQDRKHGVLVAIEGKAAERFETPRGSGVRQSVGEALRTSMRAQGWYEADDWAARADRPAPTLVGGSWDRGGADLGPTGSKRAWARLGVDGGTVGDEVPAHDFLWDPQAGRKGMVRLTVEQVARLQGFPSDWTISGRKTARYRQIANAMPPPLAYALGRAIGVALR
ncbi:DNA cytosine methyltransferase [Rhodococcus sp. NCIMB 12038]|nr:DNA cytosine methyltransferase [Rhodococcus sp. NCIMB 12038]